MEIINKFLDKKEIGCRECGRVVERQRVHKQGTLCFRCKQKVRVEYARKHRAEMKKLIEKAKKK